MTTAVSPSSTESECFYIGPIGLALSDERARSDQVLEFIVAPAAEELGLHAVRADQIDEPGQITLQVISHVLSAKAAVADLTGLNPNVFYELAIRHTVRKPVVLIAQDRQTLPFDLAEMRTVFFDYQDLRSADAAKTEIVRQLRKSLDGDVQSPVGVAVDLQTLRGGDTTERTLAELLTIVEELARSVGSSRHALESLIMSARAGRLSPASVEDTVKAYRALVSLVDQRGDSELESALDRLEMPINQVLRALGAAQYLPLQPGSGG